MRAEIMALPAAERLPWALEMLEELLGDKSPLISALIGAGHPPQRARILSVLTLAAPRWVASSVLIDVANPDLDHGKQLLACHMSNIRRAGIPVQSITGFYRLEKPLQIDLPPPAALTRERRNIGTRPDLYPGRSGAVWSNSEDSDLKAMVFSGWCVAAMADELCRTERGVTDRIRTLGIRR